MEMIIGGAYQGKASYGKKTYPEILWKNGAGLSREELFQAEGVLNFHEFIRKEMKDGRDTGNLAALREMSRRGLWTEAALDAAADHASAGAGTAERRSVLSFLMNEKHRLFPVRKGKYEL